MALLPHQIDDFVNLTLSTFEYGDWTDISLAFQEYFASSFYEKGRVKKAGGPDLRFKVQVANHGNARVSGMYDVDQLNVKNLTKEVIVKWAKITTNFEYDIDEEFFQSDRETIVDEMKVREHAMFNDWWELLEDLVWAAPSGPNQDPMPLWGVPYWIVKNATEGFNGGIPAGFSDVGGLSPTTYPNWRNWTALYAAVTRDDLIEKWIKASEYTKFKAPHNYPEVSTGRGANDRSYFTVFSVWSTLNKHLESRNDNLGPDLAKYVGKVVFRSVPVEWVPWLTENDTSNPVYGIHWRYFCMFTKTGRERVMHPVKQAAHQHTVRERHMDGWQNLGCYNRRRQFVLSLSA